MNLPSRFFLSACAAAIAASAVPAQLITYESVAKASVWSRSGPASAWQNVSKPGRYFGRVLSNTRLNGARCSREPIQLAAGTYVASALVKRTSGLATPLAIRATAPGLDVSSTTPSASLPAGQWVCLEQLRFELDEPTAVRFVVGNQDSAVPTAQMEWESFVLERVLDPSLQLSGTMANWTPAVSASKFSTRRSFATTLGDTLELDSSGLKNVRLRSPQITLPKGDYSWYCHLRKAGAAADTDDLRFSIEGITSPPSRTLPKSAQPLGRWVRSPEVAFSLSSSTTINLFAFKNSPIAKKDYQFGQFFIRRHVRPLLYFKFDRGGHDIAVNYGSAPVQGVVGSNTNPWVSGRFGGALAGHGGNGANGFSRCSTGWRGGHKGAMTLSFWLKFRHPTPTQATILGGNLSFKVYAIGGLSPSLNGLYAILGSAASRCPLKLSELNTLARRAEGVTITLLMQGRTANWYRDGMLLGSPITRDPVDIPIGSGDLVIGQDANGRYPSSYDIDEVRLYDRVVAPSVFKRWSLQPSAAVGSYGDRCGVTLSTTGGAPTVGNESYAHTLVGPPNMVFLFVIGALPQAGFDLGNAFPSLAGCRFYAQFLVQLRAATGPSGVLTLPSGLPYNPSMAGLGIDSQVLGFSGLGLSQGHVSNALSHKIQMN